MSAFRHALAAVLFLAFLTPATRAQGQVVKIGVFDENEILTGSKLGQRLQDEINRFRIEREAEFKRKREEAQKLKEQYDATVSTMSPERREQVEGDLVERRRELERLAKDAEVDVQRRLQKGLRQLAEEVGTVLRDYGSKNGFTIILERSTCAYVGNATDVSADLIRLVDARQPAK